MDLRELPIFGFSESIVRFGHGFPFGFLRKY
jgi:hypothetical protein